MSDESAAALPPIKPRRMGQPAPIVSHAPVAAVALPWSLRAGKPCLVIVAKLSFDLVDGGPAMLRDELDYPLGDVHYGEFPESGVEGPTELTVRKLKADVVAKGTAYPRGGRARNMEVLLRFGDHTRPGAGFERRLYVVGDRSYSKPNEPAEFESMPLVYERAFGGLEDLANPAGRGRGVDPRMPNLEDPQAPVQSPEDAREPVCFAAVPLAWRTKALPPIDDVKAYAARWPYFPDDFDFSALQSAPLAQQLNAIRGDEPYDVRGFHADKARFAGKLPGVRVRCFADRLTAVGRRLGEIALRLDTCAFDFDDGKLSLTWRGDFDVLDDKSSDVLALYFRNEPLDQPTSIEEVTRGYVVAQTSLALVEDEPPAEPLANENGLPPDTELEQWLARAERHRGSAFRAALLETEASEEPAAEDAKLATLPPPMPPAIAALKREQLVWQIDEGLDLKGIDWTGADLNGFNLMGKDLSDAVLVGADLRHARLDGANLTGAQLSGAIAVQARLTEACLDGADLTGADLSQAVLDGCSLNGTDLSNAIAERASFSRVHGKGATFFHAFCTAANFSEAKLEAADFSEAVLNGANFEGAVLPDLRLYDARAAAVKLRGADLTRARANGALLTKSNAEDLVAPDSFWDDADLTGSNFTRAELPRAIMNNISAEQTIFGKADMSGAKLKEAQLGRAMMVGANLMHADLEASNLEGADLRKSNLHGSQLFKAKLGGCQLEGAVLTHTLLSNPIFSGV